MQRPHVLALQFILLVEGAVLHGINVVELHRHAERDGRDAVGGGDGRVAHVRRQLLEWFSDGVCDIFGHFGSSFTTLTSTTRPTKPPIRSKRSAGGTLPPWDLSLSHFVSVALWTLSRMTWLKPIFAKSIQNANAELRSLRP